MYNVKQSYWHAEFAVPPGTDLEPQFILQEAAFHGELLLTLDEMKNEQWPDVEDEE